MSIVFQLTMDCHCEKKSNFLNVFFREHFYKQRPSPLQNTLIHKKRVKEIRKGILQEAIELLECQHQCGIKLETIGLSCWLAWRLRPGATFIVDNKCENKLWKNQKKQQQQ